MDQQLHLEGIKSMSNLYKSSIAAFALSTGVLGTFQFASATIINVNASEIQGLYQTASSSGTVASVWLGSTPGEIDRKVLKFTLPAEIGANSNIVSAMLNVAAYNPGGFTAVHPVAEYLPDDTWTPATITWANQPAPSGSTYNLPVPVGGWNIYSSPDFSAELTEGGGETVSLRLRGNVEDMTQLAYNHVSLDTGNVYLTIDYVPEPSSAALLIGGALLPTARRYRR